LDGGFAAGMFERLLVAGARTDEGDSEPALCGAGGTCETVAAAAAPTSICFVMSRQ